MKVGGGGGGFSDAHCDNTKAGGDYAHVAIEANKTTAIESSNEKTKNSTTEAESIRLVGKVSSQSVEVVCKTAIGGGSLTNTEEGGVMHAGGEVEVELTSCKMPKPVGGKGEELCVVEEPFFYLGKFKTYQVAKPEEMGIEFLPMEEGGVISEVTFKDKSLNSCPIKGKQQIKGSFEGTPGGTANGKGATIWFTESMGKLTMGGNEVKILGALTWRMQSLGNPIVFTTT